MNSPDPSHQRQLWLQDLVHRYERPLLAYATRLLGGDSERAQDAVQETLLRLCRADSESIAGKIPAWLFSVCRTRVIDMRRSEKSTTPTADHVAASQLSPADEAEKHDTQRQVRQLLTKLPERQQELLQLRLHAGLSYQEIADATGMSVSNVGYQLHMAVRSLRDAMVRSDTAHIRSAPT